MPATGNRRENFVSLATLLHGKGFSQFFYTDFLHRYLEGDPNEDNAVEIPSLTSFGRVFHSLNCPGEESDLQQSVLGLSCWKALLLLWRVGQATVTGVRNFCAGMATWSDVQEN